VTSRGAYLRVARPEGAAFMDRGRTLAGAEIAAIAV
jgi:hypothetical protein